MPLRLFPSQAGEVASRHHRQMIAGQGMWVIQRGLKGFGRGDVIFYVVMRENKCFVAGR